jgi:hypothetical protein
MHNNAQKLENKLKPHQLKLATAESCKRGHSQRKRLQNPVKKYASVSEKIVHAIVKRTFK